MEPQKPNPELLLDYLYDLLDDAERRQVEQLVEESDAWRQALRKAQREQQLLATAARMQFPQVQFQAPVEAPADDRAILPMSAARDAAQKGGPARRRRGFALRYAVAASLLFLAVGLGVPSVYLWRDYQATQALAQRGHAAVAAARDHVRDAQQARQQTEAERHKKLEAAEHAARERQLNVVVTGPAAVQPGAPNAFQFQTLDHNGVPKRAEVTVRVREEGKDKPVYEHTFETSPKDGSSRVALPPDLPLKPDAKVNLEVVARHPGKPKAGGGGDGTALLEDPKKDPGQGKPATEVAVKQQLPLAAPVYVTHLTTDKPMYRPGEVVRFRSLTLERFSLKPPEEDFQVVYVLKTPLGEETEILRGRTPLTTADGKPVLGPDQKPVRGLTAGEYQIPDEAPGGEYTLSVRELSGRFPGQERKFLVNKYEKPRLNKELEFGKKSYGAGEEVTANAKVARAEGGAAVANRPVQATVQIDGQTYGTDGKPSGQPIALKTDANGAVQVKFKLPKTIDRGQGSLALTFDDGGSVETISRPIPLVSKKLDVQFYPEGGDLVVGVPNRVYFEARTMLGKPAEVKGRLVDDTGAVVLANVATLNDPDHPGVNQGHGKFDFTPVAGRKYELKVDVPVGIETRHHLPEAKADRVVMSVGKGVTAAKEKIAVTVHSPGKERSLLVGAYCRGRSLDHRLVKVARDGRETVELTPAQEVGGVYRITVFEVQRTRPNAQPTLLPVAERLVYREAVTGLHFGVKVDKVSPIPGDRVKLTFAATDENEQPAPAVVTVAVVDKSVLTLADEKTVRTMPTHFYLTTEVRRPEDLEHADFLLSPHPKAKDALDLLLGTQGWRRFAEQNPDAFRQQHHDDAERLLALMGQPNQRAVNLAELERQRIEQAFQQQLLKHQAEQAEAVAALQAAQTDATFRDAVSRANRYQQFGQWLQQAALPLTGMVVLLAAVVALGIGMARSARRALPMYLAVLVCALVLIGVLGLHLIHDRTEFDNALAQAEAARAEAREGNLDDLGIVVVTGNDPNAVNNILLGMQQPQAMPLDAKAADRPLKEAEAVPLEVPQGRMMRQQARAPMAAMNRAGQRGGEAKGAAQMLAEKKERFADKDVGRRRMNADRIEPMAKKQLAGGGFGGGRFGGMRAGGVGGLDAGLIALPPMPEPFVVREYAHTRSQELTEVRNDFTETLVWHPVLVLPDGKGEVSFHLSDSVTTFQVAVFGHTPDGRIGAVTTAVESRLPFTLEPKVPIEVTSSDTIAVPVSVANNTADARDVTVRLSAAGLKLLDGDAESRLHLTGEQRQRKVYRFRPDVIEGTASLLLEGETKPFAADSIRRVFPVVPEGFPIVTNKSDMLEKTMAVDVTLPETWLKGTLKLSAHAYPSTLATLQKGLEGLLREPGGCFEQTSTSSYPNLLILDYLRESNQANPEIEERAKKLLALGYARLTAYECPYTDAGKHGYEWFGAANNAHEALTAYGLMQFRDMARVHSVDEKMLARTQQFLVSQKDGKGGFKRNPQALDTFGRAPDDITNAYIVWALTESGKDDDVSKELNALWEQAQKSKDPYFLALVANSLLNRDRRKDGVELLKKVRDAQKPDGHVDAERTSITGSGGRDLQIETTALAVLGWLKANDPGTFNVAVQKAVTWIGQQRGGYGGFGSTQSTILALKALIAHAKANKKTAEAGEVSLFVGDQRMATRKFDAGVQEVLSLELPDAEKHLKAGKNAVRVEITGDKNVFPCTVAWEYRTLQPVSADNAPLRLKTKLDRSEANEGDAVRLTVAVENVSGKGQGMAVAVVGLPAGLTVPEDLKQLKEHATLRTVAGSASDRTVAGSASDRTVAGSASDRTERGPIDAFEVKGRELVLYWRDLAPGQKIEVPVDLIARVPGEYRGPASRAYLYYNADHKHWIEPLAMTIQAKE